VCPPVVLDLIVCAPWQPPCYPRPPIYREFECILSSPKCSNPEKLLSGKLLWIKPVPPPSMELNNKALLFWGHAAMFEARVEVVHPPEAAALSCPVEACMNLEII